MRLRLDANMRTGTILLLLWGLSLSGLFPARADAPGGALEPREKPGITEISEVPWNPQQPSMRPKVIYGDDDRIDVYEESDAQRLEWAASTCALIYSNRLTQHANGTWTISSPGAFRQGGRPPCDGEPFADQPTASFCTGFMVGSDLIATAGHCYTTANLSNVRFVFGFWMLDESTPRLTFLESEVYQGVEVVSYSGSGAYDHSIIRVDRPVTAPGATAFPVRYEGIVQPGEFLGVIGHPSGLPMKIAFGNTYVRSSDQDGFFVANLDTYGGNSGSPVINATTGILEGILVRGAPDYIFIGNCFVSNVCPDDGCRGEDVTKATVFAPYIPGPEGYSGVLQLDKSFYRCEDEMWVTVVDPDLIGETTVTVTIETSSGDEETLALPVKAGAPATFTASIALQPGEPEIDSGVLEVSHADVITVQYQDEADQDGAPATRIATAELDCDTPEVVALSIGYVSGTQVQIHITTNVISHLTLYYGDACDNLLYAATSPFSLEHVIVLNGLTPNSTYFLALSLEGQAGVIVYLDNNGVCYEVDTYGTQNYFTEGFSAANPPDVAYRQLTFTPVENPDYYLACMISAAALPVPPGGDVLALDDDGFIEIPFTHGTDIPFYGDSYDSMFVGSNGYITFGAGSTAWQADYNLHFQLPRISAFMTDLNPQQRGAVYMASLSDRYVVTFEDVPHYDHSGAYSPENTHTFQMELFFDGVIRITWLDLYASNAVVGLSAGMGVPSDLFFTDLTALTDCAYQGSYHSADIDGDWIISFEELLRVVQLYNAGAYHCDVESEDGYQPGAGAQYCPPHDSDYSPVDWRINLSELLRLIQLYNAGGYHVDVASEDGFNPDL